MKKSKQVHIDDETEATARALLALIDSLPVDGESRTTALCVALLTERHEERERHGGASATYFRNLLVIVHPDMPVHVWDGHEMKPVEFADSEGIHLVSTRDGFLG